MRINVINAFSCITQLYQTSGALMAREQTDNNVSVSVAMLAMTFICYVFQNLSTSGSLLKAGEI